MTTPRKPTSNVADADVKGRILSHTKYHPYSRLLPPLSLKDRTWPDCQITKAPEWCSVDLRDGNQALIRPMDTPRKLRVYQLLKRIGFKQIEIGFPAASETEFSFCRLLVEKDLIGTDTIPQVLTQSREALIKRTFDGINGFPRAIVHLYNSTSELQRRVVFQSSVADITAIALKGVRQIKELASRTDTAISLEYSPESFTGTEMQIALDICNAVIEEWHPTPERKMILNLPATVEMITPNVYADQIEWISRNIHKRDSVILSVHTHNDRGTGVAASELAVMAGADRVEGTLFGNGERTGNVDLITLALNLLTQGIDPELDLRDIPSIRAIMEECTEMEVGPRQPYAGDLVFTAFSGSHQDAIRKGVIARREANLNEWQVPYIPIDPADIGREFDGIIRINSQSGKGGVAFVLENTYGFHPPKLMHPELGMMTQAISEASKGEVSAEQIWNAFSAEYLERHSPYEFVSFSSEMAEFPKDQVRCTLVVRYAGELASLLGTGNGPIDACRNALLQHAGKPFSLTNYMEHSLSRGSDSKAVSFIQLEDDGGTLKWGVGVDPNIERASIRALVCAVNRLTS